METAQLVATLKEKGYRVTPQRLEVINIVLEKLAKKEHPSFNDILNEVKQKMPSISVSTVYSILKLLEETGVVVSFEHNGRTYYDSVTPHVNVVCVNSNKILDLDGGEVVEALKRAGVYPTSILVKGICREV
ncbi:Fur family transcriptional regulator [Pyrobaculum calidifontis]|uniref:Ferric uptake regulator, Fur family n=1 Tax=Pyrobaculum calidifontis (strain DSM 21063 / JCM 11548 / VA1) TaxID=410359 RepID=A3MWQ3_PYRCJ|nr:Fur family transcriptional regulator [Pyrobaculum calidifontis]ABO09070.1 ferric uptake regulator, Fur family [Pyrobaculum calidifontis JCM 11548]